MSWGDEGRGGGGGGTCGVCVCDGGRIISHMDTAVCKNNSSVFVCYMVYSMLYTTKNQHGRGSQLGGHNRNLFRPEQLSDLRLARHGVLVEIVDVRAVHDTRGIESGKDGFRRRGEARDILIGLVRTRPLNPCTMEPSGRRAWSKRHRTHHRRRGGAFR